MTTGNLNIGVKTQLLLNKIADCEKNGGNIPAIKYYIPAYDDSIFTKDSNGQITNIATPDSGLTEAVNKIDNDFLGLVKIFKIIENNTPKLRIAIDKPVSQHNFNANANIFYLLNELKEIVYILHCISQPFRTGEKWELIVDIIFPKAEMISNITENENPFNFKIASEILLPQVIFGSTQDKSDLKAGYVINEIDTVDLSNKRVLFLRSCESLSSDKTIQRSNLIIEFEAGASIDLGGHQLTFTGDSITGDVVVSNAGNEKLNFSGNKIQLNIKSDNDLCLSISSTEYFIVHNERVFSGRAATKGNELLRKKEHDISITAIQKKLSSSLSDSDKAQSKSYIDQIRTDLLGSASAKANTLGKLETAVDNINEYNESHRPGRVRQAILSGKGELVEAGDRKNSHNTISLYAGDNKEKTVFTGVNMEDWYDEMSDYPDDTPMDWNGGVCWVKARNKPLDRKLGWILKTSLYSEDAYLQLQSSAKLNSSSVSRTEFGNGYIKQKGDWEDINKSGGSYLMNSFRTTRRVKGVTRGLGNSKPYECHYNPNSGILISIHEGNSTAGQILPIPTEMKTAGCGSPALVMVKRLTTLDNGWVLWFNGMSNREFIHITDGANVQDLDNYWVNTPTASEITFGKSTYTNANNEKYLVVAFFEGKDYFAAGYKDVLAGDNVINFANNLSNASSFITKAVNIPSTNWLLNDTKRGIEKHLALDASSIEASDYGYNPISRAGKSFTYAASRRCKILYLAIKTDKISDLTLSADTEEPAILTFADGYDGQGKARDYSVSVKEDKSIINDGIAVNGELKPDSINYIYCKLVNDSLEFWVDQERPVYAPENEILITKGHGVFTDGYVNEVIGEFGKFNTSSVYKSPANEYYNLSQILCDGSLFWHSAPEQSLVDQSFNFTSDFLVQPTKIDISLGGANNPNQWLIDWLLRASETPNLTTTDSIPSTDIIKNTNDDWSSGAKRSYKFKNLGFYKMFQILASATGDGNMKLGGFKLWGVPSALFNTEEYKFYNKGIPEKRLYLAEVETDKDKDITYITQSPKGDCWESEPFGIINGQQCYSVENAFRTEKISAETMIRFNENYPWAAALIDCDSSNTWRGLSPAIIDSNLISIITANDKVSPIFLSLSSVGRSSFPGYNQTKGQCKFKLKRNF